MKPSPTTTAGLDSELEAFWQAHPAPRNWHAAWRVGLVLEIALLLIVLQYAVDTAIIDGDFFPAPVSVAESIVTLVTGEVFVRDLVYSSSNYVIGVVLACIVGITVGLAIGLSSLLALTMKPIVWALYAIPKVALAPLMILVLGLGSPSKVAMVFLLSVFPVLINTMDGVRTVDPTLLRAAGVYGFRRLRLARSVIIPATIPFIIVGIRRAIALGFIGEILGEFLGSTQGLGVRLQQAVSAFQMADAFAVVVVMVLAANLGLLILDRVQLAVAPWSLDANAR